MLGESEAILPLTEIKLRSPVKIMQFHVLLLLLAALQPIDTDVLQFYV